MGQRETVLDISGLHSSYGMIKAIKDINIHVDKGELVSLLGANGAGKSTLLKSIIGMVHIESGSVKYQGEELVGRKSHEIIPMGISIVPEGRKIFADATVMENLAIGSYTRAADKALDQKILDQVFELKFSVVLMIIFGLFTLHTAWKAVKKKEDVKKLAIRWVIWGVVLAVVLNAPVLGKVVAKCDVPIITLLFIILVSVLCQYITKTKLGQDFRSVGSDIKIAEASGINVDRIRILATIFSTVLAGWGQFVFLQNMGTFSTYTAQQNVGTFSIAALLVGGASIDKANVKQAFTGVVLFQLLFLLAPAAGTKIFNDSQVGEYFRTVISNGVIAVALVLHAIHKMKAAKEEA